MYYLQYVLLIYSQQTRDIGPMQAARFPSPRMLPLLVQCWAIVVDDGPTLSQHWVHITYRENCLVVCFKILHVTDNKYIVDTISGNKVLDKDMPKINMHFIKMLCCVQSDRLNSCFGFLCQLWPIIDPTIIWST